MKKQIPVKNIFCSFCSEVFLKKKKVFAKTFFGCTHNCARKEKLVNNFFLLRKVLFDIFHVILIFLFFVLFYQQLCFVNICVSPLFVFHNYLCFLTIGDSSLFVFHHNLFFISNCMFFVIFIVSSTIVFHQYLCFITICVS